jgi:hypothetical protein
MVINKKSSFNNDARLSMLQILVDYLKTTHPLNLIIHMIYITVICGILSTSYVMAFHWNDVVTMYNNYVEQVAGEERYELDLDTNTQVNYKLQTLLTEVDGMRAYVYRYHGNLDTVSGVPFFYQSNIFEIISPGAARLMDYEQRVPAGIHMAMNNEFVKDRCMLIKDTTTDNNSQNYYIYTSRNAMAIERCPIFLSNGDLFGFVGIDWDTPIENTENLTGKLHTVAADLGIIFSKIAKE